MNSALPSLHCIKQNNYDGGLSMVTYEDFKEYMRQMAEEDIGCRAVLRKVRKLNGVVLDGLSIMTAESKVSPTIYLNEFYDYFKNAKESDDDALKIIWNSIKKSYYRHLNDVSFNNEDFMKWENIKDKLSIKLINTARNKALLEDIVSIPFLDLSIIFIVCIDDIAGEKGYITVRHEHLEYWGVTAEDMYETAKHNTEDNWEIVPLSSFLNMLIGTSDHDEEMFGIKMYVVSNREKTFGAATMVNGAVMEEICRRTGCKKLTIIPSSIHETIVIPTCEESIPADWINNMIMEVNKTTLDETEILSNHFYVYDLEEHMLVA